MKKSGTNGIAFKAKTGCSRAVRLAKEEKSSERAEDQPLDLDYAQNLLDGCFRATPLRAAPSGSTTDASVD
jgi:hypothetical protein